jgi:hypothetical protein
MRMMERNKDCMYCMEDERRDNLMIEIGKLNVSKLGINFRNETWKNLLIR